MSDDKAAVEVVSGAEVERKSRNVWADGLDLISAALRKFSDEEFMASSQTLRELLGDGVALNSAAHPGSDLTASPGAIGVGVVTKNEDGSVRLTIGDVGPSKFTAGDVWVKMSTEPVPGPRLTDDHEFSLGSVETMEMEVAELRPPHTAGSASPHFVWCDPGLRLGTSNSDVNPLRDHNPRVWLWNPIHETWTIPTLVESKLSDASVPAAAAHRMGYRYLGPAEYVRDTSIGGLNWDAADKFMANLLTTPLDRACSARDEALALVEQFRKAERSWYALDVERQSNAAHAAQTIDSLTTQCNALRDALAKFTDPDVNPPEPPINRALRVKIGDPRRMGIGGTG